MFWLNTNLLPVPKTFLLHKVVLLSEFVQSLIFLVVTLYATLGEQAITHGINETEVSIVITSASLLPKFKVGACLAKS